MNMKNGTKPNKTDARCRTERKKIENNNAYNEIQNENVCLTTFMHTRHCL